MGTTYEFSGLTYREFDPSTGSSEEKILVDGGYYSPYGEWFSNAASLSYLLGQGWQRIPSSQHIEFVSEDELDCACSGHPDCTREDIFLHRIERTERESHGIPIEYTETLDGKSVRSMKSLGLNVQ